MLHVFDSVKVLQSLYPGAALTTDTTGTAYVDTNGYNDGMLVVIPGAITCAGTDGYTVSVLEGDTTASMAAATISVTYNTGSTAYTPLVARIRGLGVNRKRYLQAKLTCSATTISFVGAAVFALGNADSNPVNVDLTN